MKILISSNGPMAPTGYGVQCSLLIDRLVADGHTVAVACNYGHQCGVSSWQTESGGTVTLYPQGETTTSDDMLMAYAQHFFEGDPAAGWIFILNDVWAFRDSTWMRDFNVAAWVPVDHVVCPPAVYKFFLDSGATPLAMSRHGEAELARLGLNPTYIPLAVDTSTFKPSFTQRAGDLDINSRDYHRIPPGAFAVGVCAMNKGWVFDRKGFSEAFYAFGKFWKTHPNAVLYLHTDPLGFDGIALKHLAVAAGIPEQALIWSSQFAMRLGFKRDMMASLYTALDVLLAPSHGEGFCVPMVEAQACGTPVVASRATSQAELIGAGWPVDGQLVWDHSQAAPAYMPFIDSVVEGLTAAYDAGEELVEMQIAAVEWARTYEADTVFDTYWRPFLATLTAGEPAADKPTMDRVAVIVPVMQRPQNVAPLVESFNKSNDGTARLYFVCDPDDEEEIEAVKWSGAELLISDRGHTFAQKANVGYQQTDQDWLFLCGDDVEFTDGWLAEARELSDRWDVIGTNDAEPGRVRNPDVAAGRHADHWFTRRAYIDETGSSLEGPGVFCPEAYYHWWTDKEVIGLARARGVYGHAEESRVVHHHPGFDGREDLREADPVYMKAVEWKDRDRIAFMRRAPLIESQRVTRGRAA